METYAKTLKLLGHPDRLRILALLRRGELTVSELVSVLDLSQPRVTQYIRSLEDAGIVERLREGSWVFSRLRTDQSDLSRLVSAVLDTMPTDDIMLRDDLDRLRLVREQRASRAERFFSDVANNRGQLSHEFLPQKQVEAAILSAVRRRVFDYMVDLGSGSGRMLALLSPYVKRGTGVDLSSDMLRVARHTLVDDRFAHLSVQQADLCATPLAEGVADLVTLHQVLHYLDQPGDALDEAERLLQPNGVLLIVDFAEHDREDFRDQYAHRRLGFSEVELSDLIAARAFGEITCRRIQAADGSQPDLVIWQAVRSPISAVEPVL